MVLVNQLKLKYSATTKLPNPLTVIILKPRSNIFFCPQPVLTFSNSYYNRQPCILSAIVFAYYSTLYYWSICMNNICIHKCTISKLIQNPKNHFISTREYTQTPTSEKNLFLQYGNVGQIYHLA